MGTVRRCSPPQAWLVECTQSYTNACIASCKRLDENNAVDTQQACMETQCCPVCKVFIFGMLAGPIAAGAIAAFNASGLGHHVQVGLSFYRHHRMCDQVTVNGLLRAGLPARCQLLLQTDRLQDYLEDGLQLLQDPWRYAAAILVLSETNLRLANLTLPWGFRPGTSPGPAC